MPLFLMRYAVDSDYLRSLFSPERIEAARNPAGGPGPTEEAALAVGVGVRGVFYEPATGEVLVFLVAPDDVTASAFAFPWVKAGQAGRARVTRLFSEEEVPALLIRAAGSSGPGGGR